MKSRSRFKGAIRESEKRRATRNSRRLARFLRDFCTPKSSTDRRTTTDLLRPGSAPGASPVNVKLLESHYAAPRGERRFTFEMTDQSAVSRPEVAGRGTGEGGRPLVLNRPGPRRGT